MLGLAASDLRPDAALAELLAVWVGVVAAVGEQPLRPPSGPAEPAPRMRYPVHERDQLGDVVLLHDHTLNPPFAQLALLVKALPASGNKDGRRARTAATAPLTAAKRPGKAKTPGPHTKVGGSYLPLMVEPRGLEPLTFWLPARRSPS